MPRLLVDASFLIALGKTGSLDLLDMVPGPACTTRTVLEEATNPAYPESDEIRALASQGSLKILETPGRSEASDAIGRGEQTLFEAYEEGDVLVLDDGAARRVAEVKGYRFTGTLGFLVSTAETGWVSPNRARTVLEDLAESDVRMTVTLYKRIRSRLQQETEP